MIAFANPDAARRRALAAALSRVLSPAQMSAAREMILAEDPDRPEPQPEDILYWMRVNMPVATRRVEQLLRG